MAMTQGGTSDRYRPKAAIKYHSLLVTQMMRHAVNALILVEY